jgi:hypothetical protein
MNINTDPTIGANTTIGEYSNKGVTLQGNDIYLNSMYGVSTLNNTLDDGSGNMSVTGTITSPQIELNSNGGSYTPYSTFQMDYNAGGEVGGNLGKFTIGSDSGSWGQLQEYSPNAGEVSNVFCSDCIQNGDGTLSNVNGDSDTTFAFGVASFDGDTSHFNIGSNGTGGVVFAVDGDASSTMPGYDGDAGMILLPNQNSCNGPTDALSTDGIGGVFCNTSLSDQRLKKNIISLDASSSLAELMLLNPVTYNWNDSYYTTPTGEHDGISSTTPQLGLLAQQVQTLFPSLVQGTTSTTMEVVLKRNDGGKVIGTTTEQVQNYLSVDYVHMIPVLISAIQEQQTEVKQLQATIASTTDNQYAIPMTIIGNSPDANTTTFDSALLPSADNTYSLGASGSRWSTLYSQTLNTGDLIFGNNFDLLESKNPNGTIATSTGAGMVWENGTGTPIFSLDASGNLAVNGSITAGGDVCAFGTQCLSSTWNNVNTLTNQINALSSTTITLGNVNAVLNNQVSQLSTASTSISDLTAQLSDLSTQITILSSTTSLWLSSTSTTFTSLITDIASSTFASSTATITSTIASSTSFIQTIANAVVTVLESSGQVIQSAGSWVVGQIHASLAVFDRVETQTAAVSNGIEMTDSVTGNIWCLRISNGNWDKTAGQCAAQTSSASTTTNPTSGTSMTVGTENEGTASQTVDVTTSSLNNPVISAPVSVTGVTSSSTASTSTTSTDETSTSTQSTQAAPTTGTSASITGGSVSAPVNPTGASSTDEDTTQTSIDTGTAPAGSGASSASDSSSVEVTQTSAPTSAPDSASSSGQ